MKWYVCDRDDGVLQRVLVGDVVVKVMVLQFQKLKL